MFARRKAAKSSVPEFALEPCHEDRELRRRLLVGAVEQEVQRLLDGSQSRSSQPIVVALDMPEVLMSVGMVGAGGAGPSGDREDAASATP